MIGSFFIAGLVMMVAGAVVGVANALDPWTWGRWLALHLLFVGGVSQLILGASQFFAGAFLATDPPRRRLIRLQLVGWNVGAIAIAISVPLDIPRLTDAGAAVLLGMLVAYGAGFAEMWGRSLGSAPWASRWYLAAAALFGVGIVAGAALAGGSSWARGDLLDAHMALNLGGWFGTAIVGTLHTFFPSLTQSRLRFARLQMPTFAAWVGGVAALAAGYGLGADAAALAGWVLLVAAAAMLVANIAGSLLAAPRKLSLAARMVTVAQLFLVAGLLVAAVAAFSEGPADALAGSTRGAVGTLLVGGWIGLTVMGSLLHLLALLIRVRDMNRGMPEPRPALDSALTALATIGVAGTAAGQLAAAEPLEDLARLALVAAYIVLGVRIVLLGGRVLLAARPRI